MTRFAASNLSVKKQCEKFFNDAHIILYLELSLKFVWFSFIVVVALPQKFRGPLVAFGSNKKHTFSAYTVVTHPM